MKLPALLLCTALLAAAAAAHQQQQPLAKQHTLLHRPPMAASSDAPTGSPLLADILPLDRQISIFAGFARGVESVSALLADRAENTTVLAPSNVALSRLPRKPWEDPDDAADAAAAGRAVADLYAGAQGEDRAANNLRRFVEAHMVARSPWAEREKIKTLEGVEVWWERRADGATWIMPADVKVVQVKTEVANGQLWIIDGIVNYDR